MNEIVFENTIIHKSCWESRGIRIENFLQSGAFGSVYYACLKDQCHYVVKVFSTKESSKEIELSVLFGKKDIGPKVYDYFYCSNVNFLVMEKLEKSLSDLLLFEGPLISEEIKEQIVNKYNQMLDLGFLYTDFHPGNIMFDKNNTVFFIDFDQMISNENYDPLSISDLDIKLKNWYKRLKFYKQKK